MSGIFGVADPRQQGNIHFLANKMSEVMSHRNWFVSESFVDDEHHLTLGRIGIGIFNNLIQGFVLIQPFGCGLRANTRYTWNVVRFVTDQG